MINILKRIFAWSKKNKIKANIILRENHNITRKKVSKNALKVLYRLRGSGFSAYLVGGGVRDLLLNKRPKDFDIATNAKPEQVRTLFKNCRLIGKRFRLAHIYFGPDIIEVATFRANHSSKAKAKFAKKNSTGRLLRDNVYGSIEDDVFRRDFTINALYYNIDDFTVVDYVGGVLDLKNKIIRLIGDPKLRYIEDPVRILRAIRFSSKLGFEIHENTAEPITQIAKLLAEVPEARLLDELIKLFSHGHAVTTLKLLKQYKLLDYLVYGLDEALKDKNNETFLLRAFETTDQRVKRGKPLKLSFLLANIFWIILPSEFKNQKYNESKWYLEFSALMQNQRKVINIPKKIAYEMKDIWKESYKLTILTTKNIDKSYKSPLFRAGYDFLLIRAKAKDQLAMQFAPWWQDFVAAGTEKQQELINKIKITKKAEHE